MKVKGLLAAFTILGATLLPSQAAFSAPAGPPIICEAHGLVNPSETSHITLWVETNIRDPHAVYSFKITMVTGKTHIYSPSFQFGTYSMPRKPRPWNSDEVVRVDAWEAGTRCPTSDYMFD